MRADPEILPDEFNFASISSAGSQSLAEALNLATRLNAWRQSAECAISASGLRHCLSGRGLHQLAHDGLSGSRRISHDISTAPDSCNYIACSGLSQFPTQFAHKDINNLDVGLVNAAIDLTKK